jgi:hypothetical protein
VNLFEKIRAWWLGSPPPVLRRAPGGTSWYEHNRAAIGFSCPCGLVMAFSASDLFVRDRDHVTDCPGAMCRCPILSARFCKICPNCRRGHWKDAMPEKRKPYVVS